MVRNEGHQPPQLHQGGHHQEHPAGRPGAEEPDLPNATEQLSVKLLPTSLLDFPQTQEQQQKLHTILHPFS